MKTRWSTVLAALCLTLMALGSGRAAHAASVEGAGTFVSTAYGVLHFNVHARSDAGGTVDGWVRVYSGRDYVFCDVKALSLTFGFDGSFAAAEVTAVVRHSTLPGIPPNAVVGFAFLVNELGTQVRSRPFGPVDFTRITSGHINIRA
jgi:hypothetical protein